MSVLFAAIEGTNPRSPDRPATLPAPVPSDRQGALPDNAPKESQPSAHAPRNASRPLPRTPSISRGGAKLKDKLSDQLDRSLDQLIDGLAAPVHNGRGMVSQTGTIPQPSSSGSSSGSPHAAPTAAPTAEAPSPAPQKLPTPLPPFSATGPLMRMEEDVNEVGSRTRELVLGTAGCPSLIPSGITLAGTSEARVGFRFERSSPPFVQILACLSGEGEVLVNGQWVKCTAGQAYITPQRTPHAYRALPGAVWKLVWLMYGESAVTIEGPPTLKAVDVPLLESTFLGLYRELHAAAEPAVLASWTHLLDTTARRMLARQVHDPRMSELWETIARDMTRTWTLEEMAKVAHLSPEHLRRLCHATFHRSPMRHLTYLRMRHAAELLALTDQKIEAVGRQVGYDNAFAFSSAFKREIGMAPSACRGSRTR